jgi:hypothetical protein
MDSSSIQHGRPLRDIIEKATFPNFFVSAVYTVTGGEGARSMHLGYVILGMKRREARSRSCLKRSLGSVDSVKI